MGAEIQPRYWLPTNAFFGGGGSAQIGHHLQSLHPFCSWMDQRGAFCARGESFVALHRGTQCASSGPKGVGRRRY